MTLHLRRGVALAATALVFLHLAGCAKPKLADPEKARATLQEALEAWKSGESDESLQQRSPAIQVADVAWRNGTQLVQYEISDKDKADGYDRQFRVQLWLKDESGKEKRAKATYHVSTYPRLVVVRTDDES